MNANFLALKIHSRLKAALCASVVVVVCTLASPSTSAYSAEAAKKAVTFTALGEKFAGYEILKVGPHPLNQLAQKVDREMDGLRVIYSEDLLEASGGKGAYSFQDNILIVPEKALREETGAFDPVTLHELIHARLWTAVRGNKPLAFNGIAYNDKPEFRNRAYGSFFGIDEAVTTLFSYRYYTRLVRADLSRVRNGEDVLWRIIESLDSMRVYLARLETMLTTLHMGIDGATQKGPTAAPDELKRVNASMSWQSVANNEIRLILPSATSATTLASISDFAKNALPVLDVADKLGFDMSRMIQGSRSQRAELDEKAEKLLKLAESVIDSFSARFPEETAIMNAVETKH